MEGYRFFDLTRWGIAAEVLNEYLKVEVSRKSYYTGINFTKGKDEYLPIPQNQINYSQGNLTQNPGYL
ncbi:MAG: RagB/SusD family nutrient uptake outer membrane protein [Tannerellaceae bacterium]|nr:RagB/SusD family nutrient uptake outer membrane protein [Tannerellaceae bacterium]